jgi:UDP-galactopyranose mutase
MNTFYKLFNVKTPSKVKEIIEKEKKCLSNIPPTHRNFEQKAISLIGETVYKKLIKGYTEKQWGKACRELPAFIIERIPVRFTFDNNYFSDRFQGVPILGYTKMIKNMLKGVDIKLNKNYLENKAYYNKLAKKIIYTGPIDEYFNYKFGSLEYRSLIFKNKIMDIENFQGVAAMNYVDRETPQTRILEHKHFASTNSEKTIITYEYPKKFCKGDEPYYPVNDEKNNRLYKKYLSLLKDEKIIFGGRLGAYKYYDMDDCIKEALRLAKRYME